jgi:hypothetical protein
MFVSSVLYLTQTAPCQLNYAVLTPKLGSCMLTNKQKGRHLRTHIFLHIILHYTFLIWTLITANSTRIFGCKIDADIQ